jgi:DHA1 family tetracycline resistance protein-like MFS transporter
LPFIFILLTLVIDAIGFGLIMPMMPTLIKDVSGGDLAYAAIWGGILSTGFGLMQFLFSPLLGNLSDSYGRRPILLISLGVLAVDYLIMAIAGSLWLLFIGRLVGGITSATHSTANAYVADISSPENKAANFGLVSAAFGFGFVFGPTLGGVLSTFGPRVPFYVAAALAGMNFIFGYFILPETVTDRIRRPFELGRANPVAAFRSIGQFTGLRALMLVTFLYQVAFFVYPAVWAYFTQAKFGWSAQMVGLSLTIFGLSMAIMQGLVIRPVLARLGEERTVFFGLIVGALSLGGIALVPYGWLVMALTPLAALGAVTSPAIMGIMSRAVDENQQGELQGLTMSINSLGLLLSPVLMTMTFSYFSSVDAPIYQPGAPFILAMSLMLMSLLVFVITRRTPL